MKFYLPIISIVVVIVSVVCIASVNLKLSCQVSIPIEFQQDPPGWNPPNGESEAIRYTKGYKAFWWNCVLVKSNDLNGRCPSLCSGTPAATQGCDDGAKDSENAITELINSHKSGDVKAYLKKLARDNDAQMNIDPYFPDGPKAELFN